MTFQLGVISDREEIGDRLVACMDTLHVFLLDPWLTGESASISELWSFIATCDEAHRKADYDSSALLGLQAHIQWWMKAIAPPYVLFINDEVECGYFIDYGAIANAIKEEGLPKLDTVSDDHEGLVIELFNGMPVELFNVWLNDRKKQLFTRIWVQYPKDYVKPV